MIGNMWFHPSLILIIGGLLLPLVPRSAKKAYLLLVPLLVFGQVLNMNHLIDQVHGTIRILGFDLIFGRIDRLAQVFGHIMALMACIGTLYGLHVEEDAQHLTAWTYVAGSLGVIYCGDYLVLFLFWEVMAFSSVFLVWFRRGPNSLATGYRYLLVHTAGGLALLAGFMLRWQATGTFAFDLLDVQHPNLATYLIAIGFMLNAAVPPFHAWLPDAYGEATVAGAVFMCAFTTKTAVYALARGCAGLDILVPMGVIMALYGVVYAVLENDSRRLLAYHIISQVGYMVAGVGLGSQTAINGACAHAFAHILYKGLLFMGCGSVLQMTGQSKFSELGGLYKKMPLAFVFTLIGGLSISAFPLFSGFVSKSMIVYAGFEKHIYWAAFLLTLASAGTFLHTGLKVPYFIWFGKNNCKPETWERATDPPWNMCWAMGIASFFCIFIGCYTPYLYSLLPYPVHYEPYTAYHLSETLQILLFTALGFFLLLKKLKPEPTISIDLDWFYRMGGRGFQWLAEKPIQGTDNVVSEAYRTVGLLPLVNISRFWSWFDWNVIDTIVDGAAQTVRAIGGQVRRLQAGQIQVNMLYALSIAAIILVAIAFA